MIDFVNDAISKEMILIEEQKPTAITQNIGIVHGNVNQQGSGSINSSTMVIEGNTEQIAEIKELVDKILPHLYDIYGVPEDDTERVRDDFESIKEQIESPSPKKMRLKKAIAGIKKLFGDFTPQLAASLVAYAITEADWNAIITGIEQLIASL